MIQKKNTVIKFRFMSIFETKPTQGYIWGIEHTVLPAGGRNSALILLIGPEKCKKIKLYYNKNQRFVFIYLKNVLFSVPIRLSIKTLLRPSVAYPMHDCTGSAKRYASSRHWEYKQMIVYSIHARHL